MQQAVYARESENIVKRKGQYMKRFDVWLIIISLVYLISPVDLAPGPVDDVVLLLCTGVTEVIRYKKRKK